MACPGDLSPRLASNHLNGPAERLGRVDQLLRTRGALESYAAATAAEPRDECIPAKIACSCLALVSFSCVEAEQPNVLFIAVDELSRKLDETLATGQSTAQSPEPRPSRKIQESGR